MNGGRVSSLNVLLFRIGNYVAVNLNLCNNLAAWKLKSFCCRPLLFSSLLRVCLQCSVISYSCDGTTQLHRLVSVTFNCAYLLIWFSHNVPWDTWISLDVALFLFLDIRLSCFIRHRLVEQLTTWFLCASSSSKPDTPDFILTCDERQCAVLLQQLVFDSFEVHWKSTFVWKCHALQLDWLIDWGVRGSREHFRQIHKWIWSLCLMLSVETAMRIIPFLWHGR